VSNRLTNINDRETEVMHGSEAEAWEAYHADARELVEAEVLVSAWHMFDKKADLWKSPTFDPPRVGKVTYCVYRLFDDKKEGIIHPYMGLEVDGVEGWTDGRAHMWRNA